MNRRISFSAQCQTLSLALVLLLVPVLAGCAPTYTPLPPSPEPTATSAPSTPTEIQPTATASPPEAPVLAPADMIEVEVDSKVAVTASAEGATRYEWTLQGDGEISGTSAPAIIYTAPSTGDTMAVLTVIAYNEGGASPPTSLTIRVPEALAILTVPLDALAIPAGFMSGSTNPATFIQLGRSTDNCPAGSKCTQITYQSGGQWGGLYWWPLSCGESGVPAAWNKVQHGTCGINVLQVGSMSAVNRLIFQARGNRGGEVIEFRVGALDVLPSPGRSLGKVILEPDWQLYEISLDGLDMTNAIGLFAWIAADVDNPDGAEFFLRDVLFEGVE